MPLDPNLNIYTDPEGDPFTMDQSGLINIVAPDPFQNVLPLINARFQEYGRTATPEDIAALRKQAESIGVNFADPNLGYTPQYQSWANYVANAARPQAVITQPTIVPTAQTATPPPPPTPTVNPDNWMTGFAFDQSKIPEGFNYQQYLSLYPDLAAAGIDTLLEAQRHYALYGAGEGRQYAQQTPNLEAVRKLYTDILGREADQPGLEY